MSIIEFAGSPSSINIAYSDSADVWHNSSTSWTRPNTSLYTMKKLEIGFTTTNTGYIILAYHVVDGVTRSETYSDTSAVSGNYLITLPDSWWQNKANDNITLRFKRPRSSAQNYSNIRLVLTYEDNATKSTVVVNQAIAGEPQTVTLTNTVDTVWHRVTWSYGANGYGEFGGILSNMDALNLNGNVELWNRPRVSADDMIDAGYTDFDEDSYATLYSMTYTTQDDTFTLLLTPILANGTVLSPTALDDYFDALVGTNQTINDIVQADANGSSLLIHVMSGLHIDEMDEIAEEAHVLSALWEDAVDSYGAKTRSDVLANSVTSGALDFGAATRSPAWAVPSESLGMLYAQFPTSGYITGSILVGTMTSDGIMVDESAYDAQLTIPQNSTTSPSVSVVLTKTHDAIGTASGADYLQDHTMLHITPTATAQAGASISSIAITTPDGSYSGTSGTATSLLVRTSGSYTINIVVTDSRGFSSVASQTITVTACVVPVVTGLNIFRCNVDETPNDEGTYAMVTATANVPISTWAYQITITGKGTSVETGTLSNGSGQIGNGNLDKDTGYTVTITITDALGQTNTASADLGTALYTISRMSGGKGVAFGQIPERYGVEVSKDWPFYTHGVEILKLTMDIAHPVGSILETLDVNFDPNTEWPWTLWGKVENSVLATTGFTVYIWSRSR